MTSKGKRKASTAGLDYKEGKDLSKEVKLDQEIQVTPIKDGKQLIQYLRLPNHLEIPTLEMTLHGINSIMNCANFTR
jgi:hypothetical protein